MAEFDSPAVFTDEKKTKDALKLAFAKVKSGGTKFLYYEKLKVGAKELPALAVVDFSPDFEAQMKSKAGKSPVAKGRCRATERDELAFEAESGNLKLDALAKLMSSVPGMRSVATQEAPAALGSPQAPQQVTMHVAQDAPKDAPPQDPPKPAAKPDPALLKRLGELNADVKQLPGDLAESFLGQIKKLAALVQSGTEKDKQAATKLLETLEPMLERAMGRQGGGVEASALQQARQQVEAAFKTLPAQPPTLRTDIEASQEGRAYALVAQDPAKAKLAVGAARLLVTKINETGTLARAWPATTQQALKSYNDGLDKARSSLDKAGAVRLDGHADHPAAKKVRDLCADPAAYARGTELQEALAQQAQALSELLARITLWDSTGKQADVDIKADINGLDVRYQKKVQTAIVKDPTYLGLGQLAKRGKAEVLDLGLLTEAVRQVRERIAALADEEDRRLRAADAKRQLELRRPEVDQHILDCTDLINRAGAPLAALEASWRDPAVQLELTNDTNLVTGWRGTSTTLRGDIDTAIIAMASDPPPAGPAITQATDLLAAVLQDTKPVAQRVRRNLATTSAEGILRQLETMFDLARNTHHLTNTRIGNLRAALKKTPKDKAAAQQDIDDAVDAQRRPRPAEWLKVLQLKNARVGGDLRTASVGDIMVDGKRVPVHMTLFLANVDVHNSPHIGMATPAIINLLLPDVVGHVGTHVTLEMYGQISKNNPHYFKGATSGVPNGLAGHKDWTSIEAKMSELLNKEVTRLGELVDTHKNRHGAWPGE